MFEEHTQNIIKEIEEFKKSQADDPIKTPLDPIKIFSDPIKQQLYQAVVQDGTLNYAEYAAQIGVSEATVKRRLGELKNEGIIIRHGEYMSVYANMGSVTVKEGSKVTTKQNLGTVYTNEDGSAEFSFQIWKGTASLNPRQWLR